MSPNVMFGIFLVAVLILIIRNVRKGMTPLDYQHEVEKHNAKKATKQPGDYHPTTIKRAGRTAAWVALPPLGLWRSYRHGKRKSEQRIIDEIRKNRD